MKILNNSFPQFNIIVIIILITHIFLIKSLSLQEKAELIEEHLKGPINITFSVWDINNQTEVAISDITTSFSYELRDLEETIPPNIYYYKITVILCFTMTINYYNQNKTDKITIIFKNQSADFQIYSLNLMGYLDDSFAVIFPLQIGFFNLCLSNFEQYMIYNNFEEEIKSNLISFFLFKYQIFFNDVLSNYPTCKAKFIFDFIISGFKKGLYSNTCSGPGKLCWAQLNEVTYTSFNKMGDGYATIFDLHLEIAYGITHPMTIKSVYIVSLLISPGGLKYNFRKGNKLIENQITEEIFNRMFSIGEGKK